MKTHTLIFAALLSFCILHSSFFISRSAAQAAPAPLVPLVSGTYYYQGYDADNSRHVYITASGTYYYVGDDGVAALGGTASLSPSDTTPLIIVAPQGCNQFQAVPGASVTLATGTAIGTLYILHDTGTYYVAPGSWDFNDMTFSNTGAGVTTQAAVFVQGNGSSNLGSAVFTGSNLTILGSGTSGNARRAMYLANGADAFLTDSSIIQTMANTATGVLYAFYLYGGSRFTGTRVLIEANGPQINAIYINNNIRNKLILDSSLVQNSGSVAAIRFAGSGIAMLTSSTILTSGAVAPAFQNTGARADFVFVDGIIRTTGADSPALWLGGGTNSSSYGNGITEFTGVFHNSLVLAENGAGIDINTNLPGLQSRPGIDNPQLQIAAYFDLTLVSSTLSGAHGAIRMTSSATSGLTVSEIPSKLLLNLHDSALLGDVSINDGAQLLLSATASRLDGALRLSGSAPTAAATLAGSEITGGIILTGGAALDLSANNNTTITGTFAASGNATAKVLLTGSSTIDAVSFSGNTTLELTLDNTSRVLGDFSFTGGATYTLLPAAGIRSLVFPNALTLATRGNLRVAPGTNLTLTSPLTLADPDATITIAAASGDDLVLAAGLAGKGRLVVEGIHAGALGQPELRVVRDDTGAFTASGTDVLTLAAPAGNRLFAYSGLENRPDGAWLTSGSCTPIGAAILNTPALAAVDFFDALSPVSRQLAGFRENAPRGVSLRNASADSGALWLTVRSGATTVGGDAPGLGFRQINSALTAGVDHRWGGAQGKPAMLAGGFADASYTQRDFTGNAKGSATTYGAGLYALYQRPSGWHASATFRAEEARHKLNTRSPGDTLSASHNVRAVGIAAELGWFLPGLSPAGWWADPSIEIGVASIAGASYDTLSAAADNRFHVSQATATATHARAQVSFGRDLAKNWGIRARFAAAHMDISGGDITGGGATRANFMLDGFRGEASLGFVRHLGPSARIWLDCETALAAGYKRPFMLSFGFAKAW